MINILMPQQKRIRKTRRKKKPKKVAREVVEKPKPLKVVKMVVKKCKRCKDSGSYREDETKCRTCGNKKLYIVG